MGIKDFHLHTKHLLEPVHIRKYQGQRVGCDASCWLHRGSCPSALELFHGRAPWRDRGYDPPWVDFTLKMVFTLKNFGVIPVLVFDGCRNPAKAPTNQRRSKSKAEKRAQAIALLASGQEEEANKLIRQTVDVTPEMAYELIVRLRQLGIDYVVAPYEADAQLAYLQSLPPEQGGVAAVLTEDSDLVAYGATRVLFKCAPDGSAYEFDAQAAFGLGGKSSPSSGGEVRKNGKALQFTNWTPDMMLIACVLGGCDFLPSLRGISFKTACDIVSRGGTLDGALALLRAKPRWEAELTDEYVKSLYNAVAAFKHPLVWDHVNKRCTRLTPLTDELAAFLQSDPSSAAHLGPDLQHDVAIKIVDGVINPRTLEPFPQLTLPTLNTRRISEFGRRASPSVSSMSGNPSGAMGQQRKGNNEKECCNWAHVGAVRPSPLGPRVPAHPEQHHSPSPAAAHAFGTGRSQQQQVGTTSLRIAATGSGGVQMADMSLLYGAPQPKQGSKPSRLGQLLSKSLSSGFLSKPFDPETSAPPGLETRSHQNVDITKEAETSTPFLREGSSRGREGGGGGEACATLSRPIGDASGFVSTPVVRPDGGCSSFVPETTANQKSCGVGEDEPEVTSPLRAFKPKPVALVRDGQQKRLVTNVERCCAGRIEPPDSSVLRTVVPAKVQIQGGALVHHGSQSYGVTMSGAPKSVSSGDGLSKGRRRPGKRTLEEAANGSQRISAFFKPKVNG